MVKAVLIDFDGTLVTKDILDIVCGIAGKKEESEKISRDFYAGKLTGIAPLITRINFLRGITITQINKKLEENSYLMPGVTELFNFLKQNSIISINYSGNIIPILSFYQKLLGTDYVVGTQPKLNGDVIIGITEDDFLARDFKVDGVRKILDSLSIFPEETIAIGDSPADKTMFEFAGKSIAINPKNGIEKFSDYVIKDSLENAILLISNHRRNT